MYKMKMLKSILFCFLAGVMCLNLAAKPGDAGIAVRPMSLSANQYTPDGRTTLQEPIADQIMVEGAFYPEQADFRISRTTRYRETNPQGIWAFLERYLEYCSQADYAAIKKLYNEAGWADLLTMTGKNKSRDMMKDWQLIQASQTWIAPSLVIQTGNDSWRIYYYSDGPPWLTFTQSIVWSEADNDWRFGEMAKDPLFTQILVLIRSAGVGYLNPSYL